MPAHPSTTQRSTLARWQPFLPATTAHARDVACLTSLRFFAAAWVLSLHYAMEMPVELTGVTSFFSNGRMGVDFFFILSGFILTHVYVDSLREERFGFWRFVQKRLARLYPLHIACVLLVAGYLAAGSIMGVGVKNPEVYSWQALWPNLLLLHAWGTLDGMSWNYVSWSISAEWFAYLLFLPLSVIFLRSPWSSPAKLMLAFLFFLLLSTLSPILLGRELTHLTHDFGILRILPEFTLGIAIYHTSMDYDIDQRTGPWWLIGAVVALGIVAHFDLGGFLAVALLAFVIFASASLERQGRLRILAHRALVYLGETSYSLYMVHAIVFIVYFKGLKIILGASYDDWVWYLGPFALLMSFAAASMGYHLVEVPMRRLLTERLDMSALRRLWCGRTTPTPQIERS